MKTLLEECFYPLSKGNRILWPTDLHLIPQHKVLESGDRRLQDFLVFNNVFDCGLVCACLIISIQVGITHKDISFYK